MQILEYTSYKSYLFDFISKSKVKGIKTKMSEASGCHLAYFSKVLNSDAHFSLEQAAKLNLYLSHDKSESEYFIYLVSLEKAGNTELKEFYKAKLIEVRESNSTIESKIKKTKKLKFEDESQYFGHWLYTALFVLSSIPKYQDPESMAEKLKIPLSKVTKALDFLCKLKVVKKVEDRFVVADRRIHLSGESPLIRKHHTNWRLKAIQEIDDESYAHNLHFSTLYSMSLKDFTIIRSKLLEVIKEIEPIIADSKEEEAVSFCFDFFKL